MNTIDQQIEMLDYMLEKANSVYMNDGHGNLKWVSLPAVSISSEVYPVDCPAPCKTKRGTKATKKEENPMASYASAQIIADTTEKDQRAYLTDRLYTIRETHKDALRKQFGLIDDEAPATPAEFIQRIADGKYTIDKEMLDKKSYTPAYYIRWRDPSVVEDIKGYEAAKLKLDDAYRTAKDAAILSAIADAKTAMDTFKAWSLS